MISTKREKRVVSRENLEDDSSQSRSHCPITAWFRNNSKYMLRNRTKQTQEMNTFGSNNLSTLSGQSKNLKKNFIVDDLSSSESEDFEYFCHPLRHRILRPLSDYETGESSDRASRRSRLALPKRNVQKPEPTLKQCSDSDSSSDSSFVRPRAIKGFKRPLSPTSSSDSSDSGVPIGRRKCVKRKKLFSSSESSSSCGSSSEANYHNRGPDENTELVNTNTTGSGNSVRSHLIRNIRSRPNDTENGPDITPEPVNGDFREMLPITESESDSEVVSTTTHIVRGRRIPVIDSEDDASSHMECTSSTSRVQSFHSNFDLRDSSAIGTRDTSNRNGRNALSLQIINSNNSISASNSVSYSHNFRKLVIGTSSESGSEDESDLVSNRRNVRGRRLPLIESEDDSDSLTNNTNTEIIISPGENEVSNPDSNFNNRRRVSTCPSSNENRPNSTSNSSTRTIPLTQSEDESNSSDSEIRPRALANRMAPIFSSDNSSSTSSSSSESGDILSLRDLLPDCDEDDWIGFDVNIKAIRSKNLKNLNDNSSDSDGELEKCPICLGGFKLQEVGKPASCDHKFCSLCIKEWATKSNTCPVDRKAFNRIVIYNKFDGKNLFELAVDNITPRDDQFDFLAGLLTASSESEVTFGDSDGDGPEEICFACRHSHQPHRMISCDNCNTVYHLGCIDPPLQDFPTSNWYCRDCEYSLLVTSDSN